MGGKGTVATLAGAIAAAVLLGSAGADTAMGGEGTGTGSVAGVSLRPDLSSREAVVRFLRSVGIRQRGIVVQRGLRNYAGPRCPGKRWNCTTARRVVQVGWSHDGPSNKAECFKVTCEIVQVTPVNANNEAKCQQETGANQVCRIKQIGRTNRATVVQKILQRDQPIRAGRQKAFVDQTASGSSNTANVTQNLVQHTNVRLARSIMQSLLADQFVDVQQNGSGGASNTANTFQKLKQDAIARATGQTTPIQQLLNDRDLDTDTPRNTSAVIDQTSATGPNTVTRSQVHDIDAVATAVRGNITQVQGPRDGSGGIDGSSDDPVHQESTGLSTSDNDQTKDFNVDASTSPPGEVTQEQNDPTYCCSAQNGNPDNVFTLDQSSTVLASDPDASQTVQVHGNLSSSGNVVLNQTTNVDGEVETSSCTGSSCDQQIDAGSETPGQTTVGNTDVASFGFGGMRGSGAGTITVSGVTGEVNRALLYWNGPTNSSSPTANAAVTFAGAPVTGTNIGFSSDNCWGFANSQSYRADVTSLVSGNGEYSLADFVKPPDVEINGVSLVVFFDDGIAANDRSVVFFDGNDSNFPNQFDADGWNVTLTGVDYPGGSASLDFIVSDGQTFPDGALVVNGAEFVPAGAIFQGDSVPGGPGVFDGNLWDVESFGGLSGFLTPGPNTLTLTSGLLNDCLSAVYVAANVPAAQPPIG